MLSALISSGHSYPAMHLAVQLAHQRSVLLGPLVDYITNFVIYPIFLWAQTISSPYWAYKIYLIGANVLWQFFIFIMKDLPSVPPDAETSRYGDKLES